MATTASALLYCQQALAPSVFVLLSLLSSVADAQIAPTTQPAYGNVSDYAADRATGGIGHRFVTKTACLRCSHSASPGQTKNAA
jgi:hypothetical protein